MAVVLTELEQHFSRRHMPPFSLSEIRHLDRVHVVSLHAVLREQQVFGVNVNH